jgi:hypothetical protein
MQVKVNESESKISIKVFLPLRNSRVYVGICNVLEHLKIPFTTLLNHPSFQVIAMQNVSPRSTSEVNKYIRPKLNW